MNASLIQILILIQIQIPVPSRGQQIPPVSV